MIRFLLNCKENSKDKFLGLSVGSEIVLGVFDREMVEYLEVLFLKREM